MVKDDKFLKEIRAYALKNAIEFGEADVGRVLPKLFQHGLPKKDVKKIIPKVMEIVNEVNSMSEDERGESFEMFKDRVKERSKDLDRELPELKNASMGKVVVRIAPFPSGALHIGNAKTFLLNAMYAEKYKGKVILVMDDTIGSEAKPIDEDAYGLIEEGLKWLGIKFEKKIVYKSDRLEIYYKYAEELIEKDKAYVCTCSQEMFKKYKDSGQMCSCRNESKKKHVKHWSDMFKMKEGKAVLRLKTDMQHPNPAFRDRVLFKISDRVHLRVGKKYRIWPTLEMSWAVDDHLLGITHIIRGNDLLIESDVERFIWNVLGWKAPEIVHHGKINVSGVSSDGGISKSKARVEVRSGKYLGWDDPRTWSIQSLGRRGIGVDAFREFVREIGVSKQDVTVPIDVLYSINRKMIDADADRYFFVPDGVKLDIRKKPKVGTVKLPVHPDREESRMIKVGDIYISREDAGALRGREVRLLHLFNVRINGNGSGIGTGAGVKMIGTGKSGTGARSGVERAEFTSLDNKNIPRIQWVSGGVKARVLMPSGVWAEGLAESAIRKLRVGEMIQFERYGFCRLDKKGKDKYEFWFAHR